MWSDDDSYDDFIQRREGRRAFGSSPNKGPDRTVDAGTEVVFQ